jgi:hypothetical protein
VDSNVDVIKSKVSIDLFLEELLLEERNIDPHVFPVDLKNKFRASPKEHQKMTP